MGRRKPDYWHNATAQNDIDTLTEQHHTQNNHQLHAISQSLLL